MAKQTRTLTQVLVFKLVLNPMRDRTETQRIVAVAYEWEKLLDWYNGLKVEPYQDPGINSFSGQPTNWGKTFQKGSSLEWYNPMHFSDGRLDRHGDGIHQEWVTEQDLQQHLSHTPSIVLIP